MSVIKANTSGINGLSSNVRTIKSKTAECNTALNRVKNNLDWEVKAKSNISERVTRLQRRLNTQEDKLAACIRVLETAADNFNEKDQQLKRETKDLIYNLNMCMYVTGNIGAVAKTLSPKSNWMISSIGNINEIFNDIGNGANKILFGIIKELGYIGDIIGYGEDVKDILSGAGIGKIIKTSYSAIKDLIDFDKTVKNMGKVSRMLHPSTVKASWAKKIFDLGDYFKGAASKAKNFKTRLYNNFSKAKIKEIAKVSWLDVAVSGVVNAFDNKSEFDAGEISAGRAVAETVTETVVDVASTALLTATAAAAIGAAAGAAPALAVAGAVAVTKMGLDAVANWATGGEKDFTELASDFVLDTGAVVCKKVADGAKAVGDYISSAWDAIKPKWKFSFGF